MKVWNLIEHRFWASRVTWDSTKDGRGTWHEQMIFMLHIKHASLILKSVTFNSFYLLQVACLGKSPVSVGRVGVKRGGVRGQAQGQEQGHEGQPIIPKAQNLIFFVNSTPLTSLEQCYNTIRCNL